MPYRYEPFVSVALRRHSRVTAWCPWPGSWKIQELKPVTTALTLPGDWAVEGLPAIVQRAGPAAAERMVEFFTARIRNANTRAAYAKAVTGFLTWCDERGLELYQISSRARSATSPRST